MADDVVRGLRDLRAGGHLVRRDFQGLGVLRRAGVPTQLRGQDQRAFLFGLLQNLYDGSEEVVQWTPGFAVQLLLLVSVLFLLTTTFLLLLLLFRFLLLLFGLFGVLQGKLRERSGHFKVQLRQLQNGAHHPRTPPVWMQQLQQQEDPAAGVLAVAQLELCRSCQQVVQEQEPMFALHRLWVTCRQHLIGHRDSGRSSDVIHVGVLQMRQPPSDVLPTVRLRADRRGVRIDDPPGLSATRRDPHRKSGVAGSEGLQLIVAVPQEALGQQWECLELQHPLQQHHDLRRRHALVKRAEDGSLQIFVHLLRIFTHAVQFAFEGLAVELLCDDVMDDPLLFEQQL
mmetsp:Transcript_87073/g.144827  ORF Transcript_87073/g.144827 Transcript_87073/m.144827 type:complete len:341 (+) Transcript_87073:1832-2854(+)